MSCQEFRKMRALPIIATAALTALALSTISGVAFAGSPYAGDYTGTYSGTIDSFLADSGTFAFDVNSLGNINGTVTDTGFDVTFGIGGTVLSDGSATFDLPAYPDDPASITGTFGSHAVSGTYSGSYDDNGIVDITSGTFAGSDPPGAAPEMSTAQSFGLATFLAAFALLAGHKKRTSKSASL
jgi:hypothetical protein